MPSTPSTFEIERPRRFCPAGARSGNAPSSVNALRTAYSRRAAALTRTDGAVRGAGPAGVQKPHLCAAQSSSCTASPRCPCLHRRRRRKACGAPPDMGDVRAIESERRPMAYPSIVYRRTEASMRDVARAAVGISPRQAYKTRRVADERAPASTPLSFASLQLRPAPQQT